MWCGVDGGGGGRGRGVWWGVGVEGSCGIVGSGTVVWWVGRYRRSSVMVRRGWRCWTGVNLRRNCRLRIVTRPDPSTRSTY